MPPHGKYGLTRGVRYDKVLGDFVLRCNDCADKGEAAYWPVTLEFWNPSSMQRCRACNYERKRTAERNRRLTDEVYANHQRDRLKAYYRANKETVAFKHTIYMRAYRKQAKKDPS